MEKFALAADREKALGELVPGSEDYFYYHALHYQHTRNAQRYAEIMDQWRQRFRDESPRRRVIENREALLAYEAAPQKTIDYLKNQLNVQFDHERDARDQPPNLPTALDAKLIARSVYEQDALANDASLESLSLSAAEALVAQKTKLTMEQRRAVLEKLERPDVPGLVEFIVAELKDPDSSGFGAYSVHDELLPAQLDALAKAIPSLATEEEFVKARLRKLAPSPDINVETDIAEREAWLNRLWAYAQTLPASFNTIKARMLYLRLDLDRRKGVYDGARFLEYLKIPRQMNYVQPKWLERVLQQQTAAELGEELPELFAGAAPPPDDTALVREYFLALFERAATANPGALGEAMMKPYLPYVLDTWLRPLLAEALIVGGHGAPERWASMLPAEAFAALKERVDIDFPKTNPELFTPGADVAFDVTLKNTPQLLVKIYELNALNILRDKQEQLNTDLPVDGLVANTEQTHTFATGPFRRARQTFKFPELKGRRGAWLIEFIGGGRSSRALVRVGQWQVVQHSGPSGDVLHVLDENRQLVNDAVAWLDGRKYTRNEKLGGIPIPFTSEPGEKPVIVGTPDGTFATLTEMFRHSEHYNFDAQFHIEREQLLGGRTATLAVRTALFTGDAQLDPSILRDLRLIVTATTRDTISTTQVYENLKLGTASVLTQQIAVPENLYTLHVELTAKVDSLTEENEKRDLSASRLWEVNEIDGTAFTSDGFFSKIGSEYVYELRGKNGEPRVEKPVSFSVTRRGFSRPQTVNLKTDAKGRVQLGNLAGIAGIAAVAPNGRSSSLAPRDYDRTWDETIHVGAGQPARIPAPPTLPADPQALAREISLLQHTQGWFVADQISKVKLENGFLVIDGLTPGDYSLRFRGDEREVEIKVSGSKAQHGWYFGKARNLESQGEAPLQVTGLAIDNDAITVKLANATPFTRVHIASTRFDPGLGIFGGLGQFTRFGPSSGTPARRPNLYSADRSIGDEYRYILERRFTKTFPGNMLTRPGLLINPWEVRGTDLQVAEQKQGEAPKAMDEDEDGEMGVAKSVVPLESEDHQGSSATANYDFLAAPAPVLYNLIPEKDGSVKIDARALGDRQYVQIYAEDLGSAVWQTFALPERDTKFSDRRLKQNLDPTKPLAESKDVTILAAGKSLTLDNILTGDLETYDSIARVFTLFRALNEDPKLVEFAWILDWPELKDAEKRSKYSEFACHELNVFLWRKDPAFFEQVIRPYLANKKDKTFIDDFLTGADLTKYLEPAEHTRLNMAERALLALRIKEANSARELRERWEIVPPDPQLQDRLFETALHGRELHVSDPASPAGGVEFQEAKKEAVTYAGAAVLSPKAMPKMAAPAADHPAPPAGPVAETLSTTIAGKPSSNAPAGGAAGAAGALGVKLQRGFALNEKEMEGLAQMPADRFEGVDGGVVAEKRKDAELHFGAIALGRQPITAGNRSGNLAISSNAIDALLFDTDSTVALREAYRALYRTLGPTKEWAENNYYKLRITDQNAGLIPINAFWRDYAAWITDGANGAFLSPRIAEASRNFPEMMLALAVLDLPFSAEKHETKAGDGKFTLNARGGVIAYHKQIKPAERPKAGVPQKLLVSQSFFREGDRYRMEGNEKFEKYVTKEFLTGTTYGASVVVTNPTSAPVSGEVLLQIPQGAIPTSGNKATDAKRVRLNPYTTQTFEYYFYFPATPADGGNFAHFPVSVSVAGKPGELPMVASAEPFVFHVVDKLTEVDKASWDYLSQNGTEAEVFTYLEQNNLANTDFNRIAWRCQDAAFFRKLTAFLRAHHAWNETIYSYALMHNDAAALREWIQHKDDFVKACGPWFSSKLVLLDAIERRTYEHLEYSPLVNQRAHRLGKDWKIANPAEREQYQRLLEIIAHKPELAPMDQLSATYYLFLQDRVSEGLERLGAVDANALPTKLQLDYLRCYADLYEGKLADARGIAAKYADYPVPRWRLLFADATAQLDEAEGRKSNVEIGNKPDREKAQSELSASEPTFDFKVENNAIALTWANLGEVTINYYLMDPEFAFSSSPFVKQDAARFSVIRPKRTSKVELPKDKSATEISLPAEFVKSNVLIEVVGAGTKKAQANYANTLRLMVTENFGRLEARDAANDRPLPKAYVKVYARLKNGTVRFFKDGYTDLRGRFDYSSLNSPSSNTPPPPPAPPQPPRPFGPGPADSLNYQMLKPSELNEVEKLAILVLSESNGAMTREVNPPRQ